MKLRLREVKELVSAGKPGFVSRHSDARCFLTTEPYPPLTLRQGISACYSMHRAQIIAKSSLLQGRPRSGYQTNQNLG